MTTYGSSIPADMERNNRLVNANLLSVSFSQAYIQWVVTLRDYPHSPTSTLVGRVGTEEEAMRLMREMSIVGAEHIGDSQN